jgi:asparagine synthase (glutamine-hydrolysing)
VCGICGFVRPGGSPEEGSALAAAMAGTMTPRGPDDAGAWCPDGTVALGHRRLSIIDLSPAGRQPMADETGSVMAVFNGEIFNFRELRAELAARGHLFRGECDAEVIPHAYQEWGDDFPSRLRGMFAIGLWDVSRRRLLLVRDRLGIKPLVWREGPDGFVFGSELKPLLAWPGFSREIEPDALGLYLTLQYVPDPLTIFRGASKLPPGHLLVHDAAGTRVTRWWDPLAAAAEPFPDSTEEEVLDRLDALLRESIRLRLVSDVPLGAFLSGGIDSSLVWSPS